MNKTKNITIFGMIFLVLALNFVSAITVKDVSSNPSEVIPGQVADITIEIENILSDDVTDLRVKFDLSESPFAPYKSSSERFLDELDEGDEEDFEFQLIALPDTASGIYKIPIQITYSDINGTNITKNEMISLIVNSEPELKLSLEDTTIIKGKENQVSLRIINSGLADVKFLYINVENFDGVSILSENEQYIGDISSDDFDSVDYRIYISAKSSNTINLPVTIKYRDATNKEFTETKTVSMGVYSLKEAQDLGLVKKPSYTIYLISAFAIVVFFIYRIRKRMKRKKKIEGR